MGKGRVAIVGGGVSGMTAAIHARMAGANVTVFDTNKTFGKKILKTGNGRCNFANADWNVKHYHTGSPAHVKSVLTKFPLEKLLSFMESMGVLPKNKDGLYYPYSMQAKSVRDAFYMELQVMGISMVPECKITGINRDGARFVIDSPTGLSTFDACILATGGLAAADTGSDGGGLRIARDMGHNIISPLPGLCALTSDDICLRKAEGVRVDCELSLVGDKKVKEKGNLQITDYGISGICTMQLSNYVAPALREGKEISVIIDFAAEYKKSEVVKMLSSRLYDKGKGKSLASALIGFLPDKLILALINSIGLEPNVPAVNLKKEALEALAEKIKAYNLPIKDVKGFSSAQSTLGGVDLSEVDKNTLESKLIKGLFFAGEILDVCGDCGGYNIQWAISSGAVAGSSLFGGKL